MLALFLTIRIQVIRNPFQVLFSSLAADRKWRPVRSKTDTEKLYLSDCDGTPKSCHAAQSIKPVVKRVLLPDRK